MRLAMVGLALLVGAGESMAQPGTRQIEIPAGPFTMGSDDGPEDERPRHTVTLPTFHIDATPVTNAQFAAFLNARFPNAARPINARGERLFDEDDNDARLRKVAGRWRADPGHENHPVVEASWPGARDYCEWKGRRLPSEAEWEKAARGTDGRRYPWGNEPPDRSRAQFGGGWHDLASVDAHPRGAGPYGVLDMAGNGWEWVASLYRPYPYRPDDGREDQTAAGVRGTRGGGHDARPEELTTTHRGRFVSRAPASGHHNITFRCAR